MLAGMLDAQSMVQKTKYHLSKDDVDYPVNGCISVRSHWDYDGENQTLTISGVNQFGSKTLGVECSTNKTWCLWWDTSNTTNYVNDTRMINDTRRAEITVTFNKTIMDISFEPDRQAAPKHLYLSQPNNFNLLPRTGWEVDDFLLKGDHPIFQTFELMWGPICLEHEYLYFPNGNPQLNGDPHCANSRGEKFDVTFVGKVPMIIYPQGKNATEADFAVVAHVQPLRLKKCDHTYLQKVDIMWDSNCGRITAKVGKDHLPEISTITGPHGHACPTIKTVENRGPNTTVVNVGNFSVYIKQRQVVRTGLTGHRRLDMEVRGVKSAMAPVGGIMGNDDHSEYTKIAPECAAQTALQRTRGNEEFEEDRTFARVVL